MLMKWWKPDLADRSLHFQGRPLSFNSYEEYWSFCQVICFTALYNVLQIVVGLIRLAGRCRWQPQCFALRLCKQFLLDILRNEGRSAFVERKMSVLDIKTLRLFNGWFTQRLRQYRPVLLYSNLQLVSKAGSLASKNDHKISKSLNFTSKNVCDAIVYWV